MKNFCFFTEGSYTDNQKNMYDESLVEWRQFQNSNINQPKKMQRNSNLQTKQSLYLSLGKEKKISLKDIQKLQTQQQEQKEELKVPMAIRRKSCECFQCGKLNSKQKQLQDLPSIIQQKAKDGVKQRITKILTTTIRQQPFRIMNSSKQSPPSSPQVQSKSQTNIPARSSQRKSFADMEKQEKNQSSMKSKMGRQKNNNNNNNESPNVSLNTSIEKQDETIRNKRESSKNLKWGSIEDQVSEMSIEQRSSYQKRHETVIVRRSSKFEAPPSPVNNGTQKKINQPKVEGVLEKSVKEKSQFMQYMMNFLKTIIEKVQKEEQQKQSKLEQENGIAKSNEQKSNTMNGTLLHLDENDMNSLNNNSNSNNMKTQYEETNDSEVNHKRNGKSQQVSFNSKDFSRTRSSVGEMFKPRSMKVSTPSLSETIKLNQMKEKDVIISMETLSQFRDRYLKKYSDLGGQVNSNVKPKSKKNNSIQLKSGMQFSLGANNDQQMGQQNQGNNEQREKMDNLLDSLMIFSENHTRLLQSPYYAEMKSEEYVFDKQYNKKNMHQKVFTASALNDDFMSNPAMKSFYNGNNNNHNHRVQSLMNVPTLNTMTNINQSSSPTLPQSTKNQSSSKHQNKFIFLKNTPNSLLLPKTGSNYFSSTNKRNMSQNDLFQNQNSQTNKFGSYYQPLVSPKYSQSQMYLTNSSNNAINYSQPPQSAPYLKNGLNFIQSGQNRNSQLNGSHNISSLKPSSSSARFGSFQYAKPQFGKIGKNSEKTGNMNNPSTIKSLKELDALLDNSMKNSKQNSLTQSKVVLIGNERYAVLNGNENELKQTNNGNVEY